MRVISVTRLLGIPTVSFVITRKGHHHHHTVRVFFQKVNPFFSLRAPTRKVVDMINFTLNRDRLLVYSRSLSPW